LRIPFIAGNWKMHKSIDEALAFIKAFKALKRNENVDVALCVPYLQLGILKQETEGTSIRIGAQNMHFEDQGAFTGEVSAKMLKDIGIDLCIIGHSERREYFNESDASINKKLKTAFINGILPILCVGETLEQREKGKTKAIIERQIKEDLKGIQSEHVAKMVIAYEPIWAIGTGKTATPLEANETIAFIRETIKNCYDRHVAEEVRIQYGGSVKPDNATEIMKQTDIDGALVGGASLSPEEFIKIVNF